LGNLTELRFSTKTNPLGLRLGERVRVARIAFIGYTEHGEKTLTYSEEMHFSCIIIGVVKRALGNYVGHKHFMDMDGGYDEPPRLDVTKYVRLYECKTRLEEKSFLVDPDDILEVE